MKMDALDHWDLRDPAALLRELITSHGLVTGVSMLTLVDNPSGDQRLRACVPFDTSIGSAWGDDDAAELAMSRLGLKQWEFECEPKFFPTVFPVIARDGRCVARRGDFAMTHALRYANGFSAFTGSPLLITPSGWCDLFERFGAATPALADFA